MKTGGRGRADAAFRLLAERGPEGASLRELAVILYARDTSAACRAAACYAAMLCRQRGGRARQANNRVYLQTAEVEVAGK